MSFGRSLRSMCRVGPSIAAAFAFGFAALGSAPAGATALAATVGALLLAADCGCPFGAPPCAGFLAGPPLAGPPCAGPAAAGRCGPAGGLPRQELPVDPQEHQRRLGA
ncbi:hypothetical protein [Rhodococcus erythropolis]|uniref:hypothetical protein n=1 Tax=Rhodococcus erythropolis TaxID=1833 RepID=UPI00352CF608